MSKASILPVLGFVGGLLTASVGGTAYLHHQFASKEYVKEVKKDLKDYMKERFDRIDAALGVPK